MESQMRGGILPTECQQAQARAFLGSHSLSGKDTMMLVLREDGVPQLNQKLGYLDIDLNLSSKRTSLLVS